MVDLIHGWDQVPDFITNHLIPFIENAADAVGDAAGDAAEEAADEAADEIAETGKEIAQQHAAAADVLIAKKTNQVAVMGAYVLIPIAILVGALAVKIVYGIFTKTADKVGDGLKSTSKKIQSTIATADKNSPAGANKKNGKRKLLFGEILIRFVASHLSAEDLEAALKIQKESARDKKIGEILVESGKISNSDIARALKLQEKSGQTQA